MQGLSAGDVEPDLENRLFHQSVPESQPYVHSPRDLGAGAAGVRRPAFRASRVVRDDTGSGGPTRTSEDPVYIAPRSLGPCASNPVHHYHIPGEAVLGATSRYSRSPSVRPPHVASPRLYCRSVPSSAVVARLKGEPIACTFRNELGRGRHVRSLSRRTTLYLYRPWTRRARVAHGSAREGGGGHSCGFH